jgi:hypothetical protein
VNKQRLQDAQIKAATYVVARLIMKGPPEMVTPPPGPPLDEAWRRITGEMLGEAIKRAFGNG